MTQRTNTAPALFVAIGFFPNLSAYDDGEYDVLADEFDAYTVPGDHIDLDVAMLDRALFAAQGDRSRTDAINKGLISFGPSNDPF